MAQRVRVTFGSGETFEFVPDNVAALAEEDARAWLAEAFDAYDCVPSNPMGKVVLVDMIVGVARAAGATHFAAGGEWPQAYARAVARLRDGEAICVDVAAFSVE